MLIAHSLPRPRCRSIPTPPAGNASTAAHDRAGRRARLPPCRQARARVRTSAGPLPPSPPHCRDGCGGWGAGAGAGGGCHHQGRLQGAIAAIGTVARCLAPLPAAAIFSCFLTELPGAPFVLCALLQLAAAVGTLCVLGEQQHQWCKPLHVSLECPLVHSAHVQAKSPSSMHASDNKKGQTAAQEN